ncbi:hypothetical protein evm_009215 [Chilo suppressalis]|nr:hypothetical protein evm_009215 [Chilo suppressalis]
MIQLEVRVRGSRYSIEFSFATAATVNTGAYTWLGYLMKKMNIGYKNFQKTAQVLAPVTSGAKKKLITFLREVKKVIWIKRVDLPKKLDLC